jgi:hypothetical protein
MQRRTFLKLAASTTIAAGARVAFPWAAAAANGPVSYAGALYRPGGAGKIEMSVNGGKTWALHSDLGDTLSVNTLAVRNGRLGLTVGYAKRTFSLVLAQDKRSWLTA